MKRIDQIMAHPIFAYHLCKIEEAEENRIFCRHGISHLLDVARIMYIEVLERKIEIKKDVIYATALLHDIGRYEQYEKQIPHQEAGAQIATVILKECGYETEEIAAIADAIYSHREKETDGDPDSLKSLLYQADKHSRNCFTCKATKECYWKEEKRNRTISD